METWLIDVKQLRIPRPKFGSNNTNNSTSSFRHLSYKTNRPHEPPRDYNLSTSTNHNHSNDDLMNETNHHHHHHHHHHSSSGRQKIHLTTEELRQAFQEKL